MKIKLDFSNVETEEDQTQRIASAISAGVLDVLNGIRPPSLRDLELTDPDWKDRNAIEEYIASLVQESDRTTSVGKATQSRLHDAQGLASEIEDILRDAVRQINDKKAEIQAQYQRCENRRRNLALKIHEANENLAALLASQNQLEELAKLQQQLEELCEGFEAWGKARPYQVDSILLAVQAFMDGKKGFLDADDMGLGKTFKSRVVLYIIAALFVRRYGRKPRILWVTKKSLVKSNMRELLKWGEMPIIPNLGTTPETRATFFEYAIQTDSMLICSYENVRDTEIIRSMKWDIVFADEVHRLKGGANPKPTLIWTVMRDVCRSAKFIYFLSGTPIVNKGEEMWAYLHIFAPEQFPDMKKFMWKFMDATVLEDGNVEYRVNVGRLMNALEGQMIHRTKLEVGMQLPTKDRVFEYLDLDGKQAELYKQMRDQLFVWLEGADEKVALSANVIIAQINRLRQIALWPRSIKMKFPDGREFFVDCDEGVKIDRCVELVEEINDRVVIFSSQFNAPLLEVQRRLQERGLRAEVITGDTSKFTDDYELEFQQGKIDALLINMMTGGEGLNLHKSPEFWPGGASHAIFLDLWWNPAKNVQGEDRIWRDGCKEPVTIHVLQAEDTADNFVAAKVQEKAEMVAGIMDRNELRPPSEWRELLEGLI